MMATVPHVTSSLGLKKFQADGLLLTRVYMKLNGGAVDCLNRRYASTSLHGIASQTTVVIIFVTTLMFTARFVLQSGTILNKIDIAMCDVATV